MSLLKSPEEIKRSNARAALDLAEFDYLNANGWQSLGLGKWQPPPWWAKQSEHSQGHALNAQKWADANGGPTAMRTRGDDRTKAQIKAAQKKEGLR